MRALLLIGAVLATPGTAQGADYWNDPDYGGASNPRPWEDTRSGYSQGRPWGDTRDGRWQPAEEPWRQPPDSTYSPGTDPQGGYGYRPEPLRDPWTGEVVRQRPAARPGSAWNSATPERERAPLRDPWSGSWPGDGDDASNPRNRQGGDRFWGGGGEERPWGRSRPRREPPRGTANTGNQPPASAYPAQPGGWSGYPGAGAPPYPGTGTGYGYPGSFGWPGTGGPMDYFGWPSGPWSLPGGSEFPWSSGW